MRNLKAINNDLRLVATEMEKLQDRQAEIQTKIAGLKDEDQHAELPPDQLTMVAETASDSITELEAKIKHIEAARKTLQDRKEQLRKERHESEGATIVQRYIKIVKEIYRLCLQNNQQTVALMDTRKLIAELVAKASVPPEFQDTKAYEQTKNFCLPAMPADIGGHNLRLESGWTLEIELSESMIEASQEKG